MTKATKKQTEQFYSCIDELKAAMSNYPIPIVLSALTASLGGVLCMMGPTRKDAFNGADIADEELRTFILENFANFAEARAHFHRVVNE